LSVEKFVVLSVRMQPSIFEMPGILVIAALKNVVKGLVAAATFLRWFDV
jgi:hypothetical protein